MAFEPDIGEEIETEGTLMQISVPAKTNPITPNNVSDPIQAFDTLLRENLSMMENCIPAMVLSFDRVTHIASVIPLCNAKTNIGQATQRMPITVHVWRFASGGKIIDLPVKRGDTGWIIGSDFDTYEILSKNANFDPEKNEGPQTPTTKDIHKYSFGFFLPDNFCSFPDIKRFGDDIVVGEFDENGNITSASIGGGGGISMFAYNKAAGTIAKGAVLVPRDVIIIEEKNLNDFETFPSSIYIHIIAQITSSSAAKPIAEITDSMGSGNDNLNTYIPLYDFNPSTKEITMDYRGISTAGIYEYWY